MSQQLVKGSLRAVARKQKLTLAETFLSVDALVLVDVSGSMAERDVPMDGENLFGFGRSRYDEAQRQLVNLQESLPGKVGVVQFSSRVKFRPSGILLFDAEGTDLLAALSFVKPADGCGIKLVVISDGYPNDPKRTLDLAATFTTHIDTVFIGSPNDGMGKSFMAELAQVSGGISAGGDSKELGLLKDKVTLLLKS